MQIQWFFGAVTGVAADFYLRVLDGKADGGSLSGPRWIHGRTLESSFPLVSVDANRSLWHARIEEPCFWTPSTPYRYSVRMTSSSDDHHLEDFSLGVPVIVPRHRRLELAGKNWVLRGMRSTSRGQELLRACHESGTNLWVDCPGDDVCEATSMEGVFLVADLSAEQLPWIEQELRRVARWPSVGIVLLPGETRLEPALQRETSHVIRASHWSSSDPSVPSWAQLLVVAAGELTDARLEGSQGERGLLVRGDDALNSASDPGTQVARGRQACDSLQAELAGRMGGEVSAAGYLSG